MGRKCTVKDCRGSGIFKSYSFPSATNICVKWEQFVQISKPPFKAYKNSVLCALHFQEESFSGKKLKEGSIPY